MRFTAHSKKIISHRGVSLIEVVVGLAILVIVLIGLVGSFQFFLRAGLMNTSKIQAAYVVEEGAEVMRFFRDNNWTNISGLSLGTTYYIDFNGISWSTTTIATTTTNGFVRRVTVEDVYRSTSSSDIIASTSPNPNALDGNSRLVLVRVPLLQSGEIRLSTYMTNIFTD